MKTVLRHAELLFYGRENVGGGSGRKSLNRCPSREENTEFSKSTISRAECSFTVVGKTSCENIVCLVHMNAMDLARERTILADERGQARKMAVDHAKLFRRNNKVLVLTRIPQCRVTWGVFVDRDRADTVLLRLYNLGRL